MKKTLYAFLALSALVFSFFGCAVDGEVLFDDQVQVPGSRSLLTRSASGEEIELNGFMLTQATNAAPLQSGASHHFSSVGETLVSPYPVLGSGSALLDGSTVYLSNETTYNTDESYNLQGANHSIITFMKEGVPVLTLKANGTIRGSFITGAHIDMNWVVSDTPSLRGTGKISGDFYWYSETGPLTPPLGFFSMTGTIR